jgi:uncharacterized protein (PEP-CTERM system associated)
LEVGALMACSALISFGAPAAEFNAQATIGVTNTDNVTLATVNEQRETVYSAVPAFQLNHEASRFSANAAYQLQAFRFADRSDNEIFHQYDANFRAELIPENFFLDVGGSRSQTITDFTQAIPRSNLPITGNRQDQDLYFVAPSFQFALGSAVVASGEYRRSWLDFSEGASQGNQQDLANIAIDNYRNGRGLTWALRYSWQRTEYDQEFIDWEYQRATAELGFWVGGNFRVFAAGGKESPWNQPLNSDLEDTFWEAGFASQLGERLSAEFAAGDRTFGSSFRGQLDWQFKRGSTTLSYQQTPTTQGNTRFRLGTLSDPEDFDDFLTQPGNTQRFISERLQWRLGYELRRIGISLSIFDEQRTDRTAIDGTPLNDESQSGAAISLTYRLGARTTLSARGSLAERELSASNKSELVQGSISASYSLGSKTAVSLRYEYAEEDSDNTGVARDYVANAVSLFLTRSF